MRIIHQDPAVLAILKEAITLVTDNIDFPGSSRVRSIAILENDIPGADGMRCVPLPVRSTYDIDVTITELKKGWREVFPVLWHEATHPVLTTMSWAADPLATISGRSEYPGDDEPEEEPDPAEPLFARGFLDKYEEKACECVEGVAYNILRKYDQICELGKKLDEAVKKAYGG